jgi:sodium/bile acid cotransporter 7
LPYPKTSKFADENVLAGERAQAILLTVGTNVLGVVLIPLWLKAILPSAGNAGVDGLDISYADIFVKLLISSLIPTVIGKVLRDFVPAVTRFVQGHKTLLSLLNNTSLAMIIWQTISSGRDAIVGTDVGTFLCVIVSACLIHLIYLTVNTTAVCAMRVPLPEAVSVVIMASQKSAPVAVTVITYVAQDTVLQGVLAVPCVVGQLIQIFVGQPLAHYLAGRIKRWHAAKALGPKQADAELPSESLAGIDNAGKV